MRPAGDQSGTGGISSTTSAASSRVGAGTSAASNTGTPADFRFTSAELVDAATLTVLRRAR
ncbi:hypothetical protein [Micromonospora humi]|uniref:Uncharacterized protein n=1 Tax=Micromonospora humi TaxID=745366 RepID=A0A1C5J2S5_9ACTN|nr:hypothetical protein [Micromonospora humi]SCG64815.1 hypothetical protein GA0070213_108147 [Micromonospora humi]